jgi:hypothetical protein
LDYYDANYNRTSNASQPGEDNRLKEDNLYIYRYDKEGT